MHQLTNIKKTVKHNKLNKLSFSSETRRLFYLEKVLILNLKNKINKFPDKVIAEVENSSKQVFRYFFRYKPEDVILFITKNKKLWQIKFKVLPSYVKPDSQFNPVEPVEVTILLSAACVKVNPSITVLEP